MKNAILGLLAMGLIGTLAPSASAALTWSANIGGAPTGVSYVSFDSLALGNAGGTENGLTTTFLTGDGAAVQGAVSGQYAAPFISNSNGTLFGDPTVSGADTTTYITTGIGSVEFSFASSQKYFGLLWGSVDDFNTLEFYDGATLVGTLTGLDVTASASGDQGINGTFYVNINSTLAFTRVVASSSAHAFELDNVAYDAEPQDPTVPEPASLALMGLGLTGLGMLRRKRAARA